MPPPFEDTHVSIRGQAVPEPRVNANVNGVKEAQEEEEEPAVSALETAARLRRASLIILG
jgi:hypothetical protein